MKSKVKTFIFLFITSLVFCSKTTNINFIISKSKEISYSEKIKLDYNISLNSMGKDDQIFLFSLNNLYVLDDRLNIQKKLTLNSGNAPDEFLMITKLYVDEKNIYLCDVRQRKIMIFDYQTGDQIKFVKSLNISKYDIVPLMDFIISQDTLYISSAFFEKKSNKFYTGISIIDINKEKLIKNIKVNYVKNPNNMYQNTGYIIKQQNIIFYINVVNGGIVKINLCTNKLINSNKKDFLNINLGKRKGVAISKVMLINNYLFVSGIEIKDKNVILKYNLLSKNEEILYNNSILISSYFHIIANNKIYVFDTEHNRCVIYNCKIE